VRGVARIDGHAGRSQGHLLVTGRILDDGGLPIPNAPFAVSGLDAARSGCGDPSAPAPTHADESGRFCVWLAAPMGVHSVHVDVGASEWLAGASVDYSVDLAKRSVELRFDPEPRIVTLDAPTSPLDATATFDDTETSPGGTSAAGLQLSLTTETGALVASATTDRGGRATFIVDPRKLGPPGRGALRVQFAGGTDTMASEHVAPVERHTHVTLTVARSVDAASPEDGVPIEVSASSIGGLFPSGSVEARVDSVLVGAAPLDHGEATVTATFVPKTAPRTSAPPVVQLRYVPDVPWFQPAGEITVPVPLRGPSPWRQAPLAIGALAVTAWLLIGRNARRTRLDKTIVMQRPPTHEGTAGISVVHSSRTRTGKFGGRVVDAHDGAPVPRARVAVQTPSFRGESTVVSVFADDDGAFEFDLASPVPDAVMVVEAPLHTELRQKLPAAGVLEIALVSRRRKLLERLVQWAKRRGPPFDQRPEPTPGQVRRAAEGALPHAAEWASAIERAAFDKDDVDARVEEDVMALDPDKPRRDR
jgi:hypothetical protein